VAPPEQKAYCLPESARNLVVWACRVNPSAGSFFRKYAGAPRGCVDRLQQKAFPGPPTSGVIPLAQKLQREGFIMRSVLTGALAAALLTGPAIAAEPSVDVTPDHITNIARGFGSALFQKMQNGEPVVLEELPPFVTGE
jgi:hypothetical protein